MSRESGSIGRLRDYITIFVIIFITGIGYPLFNYTTSIYRAKLPDFHPLGVNFEIGVVNDPSWLNQQIESNYGIKYWKFKQDKEAGLEVHDLKPFEQELNSYDKPFNYLPYGNYNLVISLLIENGVPINWDIDASIQQSLIPFSNKFPNQNFTITTNVNYYSKLNKQYHQGIIKESELTTFINFNDWNINSNNVENTINFLVYLPKQPLKIEHSKSNSFLIPRWGGVVIYNPDVPLMKNSKLSKDTLIPILQIFQGHMFKLFGIPNNDMESYKRINLYNNVKLTYEKLSSLYKLTLKLTNINIPQSTAEEVEKSLSYLNKAVGEYDLQASLQALQSANKAFFDPTMVQQAYFPSEHKLAVLLPLLGPIGSIVIFSVMKLVKQRKVKRD